MARKRMIDPNIWQSQDFSNLPTLAKLVFIGMFSNADDEGRGRAKPVYLKSILFPYDDGMRVTDIEKSLSEISAYLSVTLYEHNGNQYYQLDNWNKWQRVEKPQPSQIPAPVNAIPQPVGEQSGNDRGVIDDESRLKEKKRKEIKYIVEYLNQKTDKTFKTTTKSTVSHINARMADGYTLDDFKAVIDKKVLDWLHDPKMSDYLRPETLFGTKFESYLNQSDVKSKNIPIAEIDDADVAMAQLYGGRRFD